MKFDKIQKKKLVIATSCDDCQEKHDGKLLETKLDLAECHLEHVYNILEDVVTR